MSFTKDISFYPSKIEHNSLTMINYSGKLKTSTRVFLEYDSAPFSGTDNESTEVIEMVNNGTGYYVMFNIDDRESLYFRFVSKEGEIDDNYGTAYTVPIGIDTSAFYNGQEPEVLNIKNEPDEELDDIISEIAKADDNVSENNTTSENSSMITIKNQDLVYVRHGLRFSYKWNKRIRLALIKLFRKLPSFITGNYRRRINL